MMRSVDSRPDCTVLDEPFFAPYLNETGKPHPGREETLEHHETSPKAASNLCAIPPANTFVYFQKHMPHHMLDGFPLDWMDGARHFFLIRHPARVIESYAKGRADFMLEDLGYPQLTQFYERLTQAPILDCDEILHDPEGQLRALCDKLEIEFDTSMLKWAKGRRESDGAWAPYWYKSVENSTGFGNPPGEIPAVKAEHWDIYRCAMVDYQAMFARRLRA